MALFKRRQWRAHVDDGGCWIWDGARTQGGYGHVNLDHRFQQAHRIVYEALVEPIPGGLELDHLCAQPACVRPDHLEVVTHVENLRRARSPYCHRGHLLTAENRARGTSCLACRPIKWREYAAKKRAADPNWRRAKA